MVIYQWSTGNGQEYIILSESEEHFTADYDSEKDAIEANTVPGFSFDQKYDTDMDTDFSGLPMDRTLMASF